MNPYDPAHLSPMPEELNSCALPYGLSWEDLQPFLPSFDPLERATAQAFASHAKQGLNGGDNSRILTLRYPIGDHQLRTETIFFKRAADQHTAEAQKYRFLHSQGFPTPRLLAALQKDGAEVILLEFLPTIGIDFSSASEVHALLYLAAVLNSLQNPPDCFNRLPGLPQAEFDEIVRTALVELAQAQGLAMGEPSRWLAAYQASQHAARRMPLAVNHNEFFFQQVGWVQRGASRHDCRPSLHGYRQLSLPSFGLFGARSAGAVPNLSALSVAAQPY
jgi:hypothetical protein